MASGDAVEADRFELKDQLGAGANGTVHCVLDRARGEEVALKTLRLHDARALYRFKREFRAAAALTHPNLVRLFELFSFGGEWMFTMERVDGVPFGKWVRPDGALDERRLRNALIQLADGVAALGLALPQETIERLLAFGELLLKWNKVYNLTAIRNPQELITHHLLDSLAVLPHLAGVCRLADIGSGGGLPGVVLAIVRPGLVVSSIETVGKKASFQQQARIELGLGNFSVLNKRVEQVQPDALPGGVPDGVISRAFSSLADFVALSGHLVAEGGALYAMKGVNPVDEIAALPAGWALAATHALNVPGLGAERHLLVIRRAG